MSFNDFNNLTRTLVRTGEDLLPSIASHKNERDERKKGKTARGKQIIFANDFVKLQSGDNSYDIHMLSFPAQIFPLKNIFVLFSSIHTSYKNKFIKVFT